ncbi:short-chain dehydrogenase (plasmid) [Deinococcus aetherius]|uniref:Short-chain dehydrogenase n=1 Tax=Deinococcus aetherius TaxID=200252 RepID=A0ABN6RKF8_9DEIO|nr:SDR family oxidoreductase [Deinococcus aetherius]BDP43820.1 short-chain dehydrogenase [Deinococcus aetherius]
MTRTQGQNMRGKTVLVTGASSGIGLATAQELARRGAAVLVHARDEARGQAAVAQIRRSSANPLVSLVLADLRSPAEVRRLARDVRAQVERLDVLINNAAIIPAKRELTPDGIEVQFAVNHLAPFMLTNELLPLLKASGAGRIVNVSSEAHRDGVVNLDDLENARQYDRPGFPVAGWQAYSNTKLMNVLFTYELARRLGGTGVTANALHPGVIGTGLTRTLPGPLRAVYGLVMPRPATGARTSVALASDPALGGRSGEYFNEKAQAVPSSDASHDEALARELWSRSEAYAR